MLSMGLVIENSARSYFENWGVLKISFLNIQILQPKFIQEKKKKITRIHFSI
jgi:hypothetical protein